MRGRKLWMRAETAIGPLAIFATTLAADVTNDDGHACDATYDPETHHLYVRWRPDEHAMKCDLHHELIHVCFRGYGGDAMNKVFGNCSSEVRERREENVVSFLDVKQYDLLVRNGWLKYPRPPSFAKRGKKVSHG